MVNGETAPVQRSTFVTVVGWVFIAFAGFATLITGLQNVMLHVFFPLEELNQIPLEDEAFGEMPFVARFMMTHMDLWFLFCFLITALTLAAAIGLVRRLGWARLLFVGILVFGVLWNLATPFLIPAMMPADDIMRGDRTFARMFVAMQVFTTVFALGMAVLFGWIAWRLCTPAIRAEFVKQ